MTVGNLVIYDNALTGIFNGTLPALPAASLSAHLLSAGYAPDTVLHSSFNDVAAFEVQGHGFEAKSLTGVHVVTGAGQVSVHSDPIIFGDPISVPPFRYLLIAYGLPGAAADNKALFGFADLSTGGGALETVRGSLHFSHGDGGWFGVSQV